MPVKFILIYVLICNVSFAQSNLLPNKFDSFIIKPTIEWAGYAYTYIDVEKINFNKPLFSRFLKNEIKVSTPGDDRPSNISKDSLDELMLYPLHHNMPMFDSNGNAIFSTIEIKPYEIDTTTSTSTNITQLLYIENGVLKSYIPWVTPSMVIVKTAQTNIFIGYAEYLSSCYNYKFNYQLKSENLYLGETIRELRTDTIDWRYLPIKELYRRCIWETLIPYVWNNTLDVFTLDSKVKLNPGQISDSVLSKINTVSAKEDYYDSSESRYVRYGYPKNYFDLEDFKEIQLIQDWYYNYTENIVFNKIRELYLCVKKWTAKGEDESASPILKIIFR